MCMDAGFTASRWSLLCADVWITYTSVYCMCVLKEHTVLTDLSQSLLQGYVDLIAHPDVVSKFVYLYHMKP